MSSKRDRVVQEMQAAAKKLYEVADIPAGAKIAIVVIAPDLHQGIMTNAGAEEIRDYVNGWADSAMALAMKGKQPD